MDFGELIKRRRNELGLTLEQVGDRCGVGKSTVRKWESGMIQNVRRDKIAQLASVLQIDPVSLIDCTPQKILHVTIKQSIELTPEESRLLSLFRGADDRAKRDAIETLEKYQVATEKKSV